METDVWFILHLLLENLCQEALRAIKELNDKLIRGRKIMVTAAAEQVCLASNSLLLKSSSPTHTQPLFVTDKLPRQGFK